MGEGTTQSGAVEFVEFGAVLVAAGSRTHVNQDIAVGQNRRRTILNAV